MTLDEALREELREDFLHTLRMDHGHTTVNDMQKCRTCTRRADLLIERMEKTLAEQP